MTLYALSGLCLAMLVLAASPGPGVFTTMARAMASGFRAALAVIAGIVFGDVIFLLLAIFGLSVIAQTLGEFFTVVKVCGGIYLMGLGYRIWKTKPKDPSIHRLDSNPRDTRGFITGLLITLSNPKVILFYCGFLPTFMDLATLTAMDILLVATLISTILVIVLAVYAFLAARARQVFCRPAAIQRLNRTAAGMMMAAGVSILATVRR